MAVVIAVVFVTTLRLTARHPRLTRLRTVHDRAVGPSLLARAVPNRGPNSSDSAGPPFGMPTLTAMPPTAFVPLVLSPAIGPTIEDMKFIKLWYAKCLERRVMADLFKVDMIETIL